MRVLGIDPGYDRVGFAVLEHDDVGKEKVLHSSCFTTSRNMAFPLRLKAIGNEMESLIGAHNPTVCAIEKLYFTSNQKTAMAVSEARGMLLHLAARAELSIFEYTPLQIKNAVTGNGRSDKKHVITMVTKLVEIAHPIHYDDEYDAIAVGLTCLASERGHTS